MSAAQIEAFIAAAKADSGLQQRLQTATDVDAVIAIARDAGFELGKEALLKCKGPSAQLDDAELERVAGGVGLFPQMFDVFQFSPLIVSNDLGPDNVQRTVRQGFAKAGLLDK